MHRRRAVTGARALLIGLALALGACGGGGKKAAPPTTTTTIAPATTTTTTVATAPTTATASAGTTTTLVTPTVSLPCQPLPVPATPVASPAASATALLTNVHETGDRCVDHVVFDFTGKTAGPPGYVLTYTTSPVTADASGAQVNVAGNAVVLVKIQPGSTFDFEAGRPTYTGPKRIAVTGANHVRELVQTGDFEGVLTWAIGLDTKRPFSVQATATPKQLVVTIS